MHLYKPNFTFIFSLFSVKINHEIFFNDEYKLFFNTIPSKGKIPYKFPLNLFDLFHVF